MSECLAPPDTPVARQPRQPFKAVSDDALIQVSRFLMTDAVVRFALTCKRLHRVLGSDTVWQPLCASDLAVTALTDIPPGCDDSATEATFHEIYRMWRHSFSDFTRAEVRQVKLWWGRMEAWLLAHAPRIHATLNPPATAAAIAAADAQLKGVRSIPRMLKLMYRFHDGQCLHADESFHAGRLTAPRRVVFESVWHGMFGGYVFYDEAINVRFLPLQHLLWFTTRTLESNDEYFRLDEVRLSDYPEAAAVAAAGSRAKRRGVVFACNFVGLQQPKLDKVFISAPADGDDDGGDAVFCNANAFKGCLPCCRGEQGSRLFSWLEEYMCRLEAGVYRYERLSYGAGGDESDPRRAISLFPAPDATLAYNRARAAAVDGDGSSSSSRSPAAQVRPIAVSAAVTLGVEVGVTPVFVPHRYLFEVDDPDSGRTQAARRLAHEQLFWTYRVRLRMLRDHPTRPPVLTRCQLTRRRWEFTEPAQGDRPPGVVTGAGVVGLFPTLAVDGDGDEGGGAGLVAASDWPFAYQSCTTATSSPAAMGGWLEFKVATRDPSQVAIPPQHASTYDDDDDDDGDEVDASLRAPGTKLFRAAVGVFALDIPDFIF